MSVRRNLMRSGLSILVLLAAPSGAKWAQCELVDVNPNGVDLRFGSSTSIEGNLLVVGAPGDAIVPGAVYLFERDAQNAFLNSRLTLSSPVVGAEFGAALALSGTTLFVGVPDDNQLGIFTGSVVVFELIGGVWTEVQVLQPSDLPTLGEFGRALDFDGTRLVVGSRFDSSSLSLAGSAYVFEDIGGLWTETAKLVATSPADGQLFGSSVAIDRDWLFCGAPGDAQNGINSGATFVYNLQGSTWIPTQKLTGSDTDAGDLFGTSLDVKGDVVMIGSPLEETNPNETDSGGVYCFDRSASVWSQHQLVFPNGSGTGDEFGFSVAFRDTNDRVIIGAPGRDDNGISSGSVYVFELTGTNFTESKRLFPSEALISMAAGERFGESVAVDGEFALCGATLGDPLDASASIGIPSQGAAYLFSLDEVICSTICKTAVDISLSGGGIQTLDFNPGSIFAGTIYLVAGSAAGRDPGLTVQGQVIPLNFDSYLVQTLTAPAGVLFFSFGVLDASGSGSTLFILPPAFDPSLEGLVLHHAFVVLDAGIKHVSRPQGLLLTQ